MDVKKILTDLVKKKPKIAISSPVEYYNPSLWYQLKQRVRHRTLDGQRIIIDIHMFKDKVISGGYVSGVGPRIEIKEYAAYDRTDLWTTESAEALQKRGYKKVEGLYDSLIWWRVPVYMRIDGAQVYDVRSAIGSDGMPLYSQDTAATLHDVMQSNATEKFIKGLGKISMSSLDIQKLVMIAIVGVGAVFGLMMMGVI